MRIKFVYTALQVRDLDRSEGFYREILGMKRVLRKAVKETDGEMCLLESGRNVLELNKYSGARVRRGNTLDHLAFEVSPHSAFVKFTEKLRGRGVEIHEYLQTQRWDRFFMEDPDGNWIEIYARKRQRAVR